MSVYITILIFLIGLGVGVHKVFQGKSEALTVTAVLNKLKLETDAH